MVGHQKPPSGVSGILHFFKPLLISIALFGTLRLSKLLPTVPKSGKEVLPQGIVKRAQGG